MAVDVNGLGSAYIPVERPRAQDNVQSPERADDRPARRENVTRNRIDLDAIDRKLGRKESIQDVYLQNQLQKPDLSRYNQQALQTYQINEQNNLDDIGGELVGLDIIV